MLGELIFLRAQRAQSHPAKGEKREEEEREGGEEGKHYWQLKFEYSAYCINHIASAIFLTAIFQQGSEQSYCKRRVLHSMDSRS